ncbi:MAG TPA: amidohydrolase [Bacteroidetes bacterium]|nr:amidohydrolase [Bacteroidota bacterium]
MMKNNLKYFLSGLMLLIVVVQVNAQIPEKATFGKYALFGGTIHTVSDGVIENGILLIDGNIISFVGSNVRITNDYTSIDITGKHVYPGLIDAGSSLGLVEISAVPVTVDNAEIGSMNPHMRAFTAINPNSVAIPVTRVEGVTTVISNPASGVISGKSTMINLYGYSPDSMAVVQDVGLFVNWPTVSRRGGWDSRTDEEIQKQYDEQIKSLDDFIADALFYHKVKEEYSTSPNGKKTPTKNSSLEAMGDIVDGKLPLIISVDRESDILKAIEWTKKNPSLKVIFSSVAEGWRVADEIAAAGIPCLVGPLLRLPTRDHDNYQRAYQNAALLHDAGVKIAIRTGDTENVRNLPFNAGYAATYGLGKDEALKAITLYPAQIFGVDDKIGSLREGLLANVVVTNGDILETMTKVEHVFINGHKIPMNSRHIQLFDEFLNRDVR